MRPISRGFSGLNAGSVWRFADYTFMCGCFFSSMLFSNLNLAFLGYLKLQLQARVKFNIDTFQYWQPSINQRVLVLIILLHLWTNQFLVQNTKFDDTVQHMLCSHENFSIFLKLSLNK